MIETEVCYYEVCSNERDNRQYKCVHWWHRLYRQLFSTETILRCVTISMYSLSSLVVFLTSLSIAFAQNDPCPPNYSYIGYRCVKHASQPLDWMSAERYCRMDGATGHLVSIDNAFTNTYVFGMYSLIKPNVNPSRSLRQSQCLRLLLNLYKCKSW